MEVKYPWPSTVNVRNFVTVMPHLREELSLINFSIWKEQMLCLVESQDVLGFINGEIMEPQNSSNVETTEKKLWRRTDRLVKGWILGTIGKDALDAVWKLQTAKEVWLELNKIFNDKTGNMEIQSERDGNNADEEVGEKWSNNEGLTSVDPTSTTGEDLNRYWPLYEAALRGDWNMAKSFFDKDKKEATEARIGAYSETALHMAVLTGKANDNDFVKKLVELMPSHALALKDRFGNTALHKAAMVGNTEAAITLVTKNPDLLYILNDDNRLPIVQASVYCHKDTLEYLISVSKTNVENSPFEGQLGIQLLNTVISSEFFDVALELAKKYPNLARSGVDMGGMCPMSVIATINSVFPSGESFSWWQKLIYNRIPVKQSKWKFAAQATRDIENEFPVSRAYDKYYTSLWIICGVKQKLEIMLWKVIELLVPGVEGIREKKAVHEQALKLVKCLSQQLSSSFESEASIMLGNSILMAAQRGISEIVEVIMEMHPMATFASDNTGRNIFHLAATYRFENVMNLIYNMSDRKFLFFDKGDMEFNNLMHMCGKLAPPDRLNLVPGAALQMQRELQWFKEMEKFVHPSRRIWGNSDKLTPKMLFTMEHEKLKEEGEKWMKDTSNACTIAAALIATVVFAAAFTVPGGIATETGIPIFSKRFAFILFVVSDAISLFTSITSLLMFVSILTSRYAEEDFLYVLPKRLSTGLLSLFISITFMLVAFSATMYLIFQGKMARFFIPMLALAVMPVTSFVASQFPLLIDVVYSTYGPGIFGKKSASLLY